jgi:hypothetical protein
MNWIFTDTEDPISSVSLWGLSVEWKGKIYFRYITHYHSYHIITVKQAWLSRATLKISSDFLFSHILYFIFILH